MKINKFCILSLTLLSVTAFATGCSNKQSTSSTSSSRYVDILPTSEEEQAFDEDTFQPSTAPYSLNVTYYSDIYSRGFAFMTNGEVSETSLFVIEGNTKNDADFANAQEIKCTSEAHGSSGTFGTYYLHQAHIENLKKNQVYSYKIGSSQGWKYGTFSTDVENAETITAIQLSDAQTKAKGQLQYWRNTFKQARLQAAKDTQNDLDFILYNGDQFDQNMGTKDQYGYVNGKAVDKIYRYAKAVEVIEDYKTSIPYMPSSGNHEPTQGDVLKEMNAINAQSDDSSGIYYSYDYSFAHFIVINTNKGSNIDISTEQLTWLENDLENCDAKWKIVMMHAGAFATGDHCSKDENKKVTEKLTPLFSKYHVDLVLQAHEHTYNKTLPYKWDLETPYLTKTSTEPMSTVVNENPEQKVIADVSYDKNPSGTYYVTTGTAGGRYGEVEADAGYYAEVVKDGDTWKGVVSGDTKSYLTRPTYKIFNGKITKSNTYKSYTCSNPSYTSSQVYEEGHLASANVNAQMFGILNLTKDTLRYDFYTSELDTTTQASQAKLFDSLNVYKGN